MKECIRKKKIAGTILIHVSQTFDLDGEIESIW